MPRPVISDISPLREPLARPACNHLWGLVLAITVSHGSMVSSAAWRSSLRRHELSQFGSVVACRHRAACVANIDSEGEIAAALSEAYGGCKARKPYTGAAWDEVREYDRRELARELAVILDSLIGTEVSHRTCAT